MCALCVQALLPAKHGDKQEEAEEKKAGRQTGREEAENRRGRQWGSGAGSDLPLCCALWHGWDRDWPFVQPSLSLLAACPASPIPSSVSLCSVSLPCVCVNFCLSLSSPVFSVSSLFSLSLSITHPPSMPGVCLVPTPVCLSFSLSLSP